MLGRTSTIVSSIPRPKVRSAGPRRTEVVWWLPVAVFWLLFLLAPGGLGAKAHLLLGGLCAQRPSHSFVFDGQHLPFDARMTGIYLGSLVTIATLFGLGRGHHAGRLSLATWTSLALFVAAMGVDGFNSLLVDLGRWHPYDPDNRIRLATGLLTGVALGTVLVMLVASSIWLSPARTSAPALSLPDLGRLVFVVLIMAAVLVRGGDWLYTPLTLFLVVGAVITVSALALVCTALVQAPYGLASGWPELRPYLGKAALLGISTILLLAALRLFAERMVGPLDRV